MAAMSVPPPPKPRDQERTQAEEKVNTASQKAGLQFVSTAVDTPIRDLIPRFARGLTFSRVLSGEFREDSCIGPGQASNPPLRLYVPACDRVATRLGHKL